MYVRTEALKPNETFYLYDHETVIHTDWPHGKMIYLVILGNQEQEDARLNALAGAVKRKWTHDPDCEGCIAKGYHGNV